MEVISRKEAKEKGLKRYFTGKPCKYGHTSERFVSTGNCLECQKDRYQQNKGQILESQKEYRRQNKEKIRGYKKEYRQKNTEYFKESI